MLAAELVGKTKQELKDLLLLNTQNYRFNDIVIGASFPIIYEMFIETDNVLIEKQIFWEMLLQGLFGLDEDTTSVLVSELGSFEFIVFCEQHLSNRKEFVIYSELYRSYHEKKSSLNTLLSTVFNAFFEDLNNIKPEEINKIISELNINLDQLPDFIKNSVK